MSEPRPHLTEEQVARVLDLVHQADAVVVGGQAMALWARRYAEYNSEISRTYTMSSEDVDFYGTRKAAEDFAAKIDNGKLFIPSIDDQPPNAAHSTTIPRIRISAVPQTRSHESATCGRKQRAFRLSRAAAHSAR